MTPTSTRRGFLRTAGLLGLGLVIPNIARAASTQIRIVSNPGLENATINALMEQQGYFRQFGVDAVIDQVSGATGPFDAIAAGTADVCMVSGYNLVLARIAQGAPVRIIGAGMKKVALTVFVQPGGPPTLAALVGKTVAVGPRLGLLHTLMLQLFRENGIDATGVRFVDKGSNEQCYEAVVKGEADACCASIAHLNNQDGLTSIRAANLWEALPRCTFQTAYASTAALADKHAGLVAVMAAYGALYEYMMSPASTDAFIAARRRVQTPFDAPSARAIADFNQQQRPYSRDLSLSDNSIAYLQDMYLNAGSLARRQPIAQVADMSAAHAAARLFDAQRAPSMPSRTAPSTSSPSASSWMARATTNAPTMPA